jgi:hypothetical protein
MKILNVAGGKMKVLPTGDKNENLLIPKFIVNVDTSYFSEMTAQQIEVHEKLFTKDPDALTENHYLNMDIFEFMERTIIDFDRVCIYRFLEHVSFTSIEYFIYLVSTVTQKGSIVDVIVPNYDRLGAFLVTEKKLFKDGHFTSYESFQSWNIQLTTELLNEPSSPHASIWTPERAKLFWELEGRFKVIEFDEKFMFDGRDIYLRFLAKRV